MKLFIRLPLLLLSLFSFLLMPGFSIAQQSQPTDGFRFHQIYLTEPVRSLEDISYDKSDYPINGRLSPDGKRVIISNYREKERVKVKVILENGETKEYIKSPCFIDPVAPAI